MLSSPLPLLSQRRAACVSRRQPLVSQTRPSRGVRACSTAFSRTLPAACPGQRRCAPPELVTLLATFPPPPSAQPTHQAPRTFALYSGSLLLVLAASRLVAPGTVQTVYFCPPSPFSSFSPLSRALAHILLAVIRHIDSVDRPRSTATPDLGRARALSACARAAPPRGRTGLLSHLPWCRSLPDWARQRRACVSRLLS